MDQGTAARHKLRNLGHTLLLIGGMSLLLAVCSELLFGKGIWPWVFFSVAVTMFTLPDIPPHWLLRLYQARPLQPQEAPLLLRLVQELSQRAGLNHSPSLYWVPSHLANAFAVGRRNHAAIAITDGLLQHLSPRELAGVLAHEISHVANNDMRLMGLADVISRLTHMMSVVGILLILISFPFMILGITPVPFLAMLLLLIAPTLSALLQLGLSRIREFNADVEAVRITGDPEGLASALGKIDLQYGSGWQRILFPGYRETEPSLLRTHPNMQERIQRLMEIAGRPEGPGAPLTHLYDRHEKLPDSLQVTRRPKHRFTLWR